MVIVGSSVARAFGLVGAASLIRYRAKIDDPKDAAVALASLTLGLCTGVALYGLALFSLIFILGVLWILESLEGESRTTFELAVGAEDPSALQPKLERVLARYRIHYELRNTGAQELVYEAKLLRTTRTGRVSDAILALEGQRDHEIRWIEVAEVPKEQ
jgi:uncharacterized membrane protein YhiD involved in acid resistance